MQPQLTQEPPATNNNVQVCRFERNGLPAVGLLKPNGAVRTIDIGSMAELLALPASEIRKVIENACGRGTDLTPDRLLPAPDRQEIWAAGVTYERSREARVAESGLVDVYNRAYDAQRPELFFKAPAERVVPPGGAGRLREDSTWDACEPELAAVANSVGEVVGYTIGNDLCSRSIEAENPLYLPQAKLYTDSCLLAPGWVPAWSWAGIGSTSIAMSLLRDGRPLYEASIALNRLRRTPDELMSWLFRELEFPPGVILLTGTGLVAPDDVMVADGDEVVISIEGLGQLRHRLYRRERRGVAVK